MTGLLKLAWSSIAGSPLRNVLLCSAIALLALLPIAVDRLMDHYETTLLKRARQTPIAIGAKGSPYALLFGALYFRGEISDAMSYDDVERVDAFGHGVAIPLVLGQRVDRQPLVGTTLDYFEFRNLDLAQGRAIALLGETVLGATAASRLGVSVDDTISTRPTRVYDLSASYPIRLRVVGVLAASGEADDDAVFVDVRTAWIAAGIGHGHDNVKSDPNYVLEEAGESVTASAALPERTEIDPQSIDQFHMHGGPDSWPVQAIVVSTLDDRERTQLSAKVDLTKTLQSIRPQSTTKELLAFVFRAKQFFDANLALATASAAMLLGLVIALTLRLRERELLTLARIGASRGWIAGLITVEFGALLAAGLIIATFAGLALAEIAIRLELLT